MSLQIKNTKTLVTPETFRWKVLVYGLPGTGKTEWLSGAPDLGVAACETGQGNGLLTIASKGIDYVTPDNLAELEAVCKGKVFPDKISVGLDSLTEMNNRFIKEAALKIPRSRGSSPKRDKGVPELDDYQVMSEICRSLLRDLLAQDRHVICTATEKHRLPDAETGQGETLIGPELPGQLFTGSTAMFDTVLRLRTRQKLRDPKDAKSRYIERYFVTQPDGQGTIAKCRNSINGKPLLEREEVFDPESGKGTFTTLLAKILNGYVETK
jgi:hypothetical protein